MKAFVLRFLSALLLVALLLAGQGVRPAYAASYVVNTTADNTTDDAFCTLREAILAANNAPANANCGAGSTVNDTITFDSSLGVATIALGSTLPNIVSGQGALTIDGGGNITISGNNSVRVMIVDSDADLTLQNLTIANGRAIEGGGVRNAGTLTITDSTFSGNSASSFYGYGGGVSNDGTLTITNSTFSGNSAGGYYGYGGGVYNDAGTLTITNSAFSGNGAGGFYGYGGGVYNSGGTLTVTNSTFSGNRAGGYGGVYSGGGVYNSGGTATLKNTIIANSTSGGDCMGAPLNGSNINNLIEDSVNACGLTHGVNGNIIGFDPNLGALTGSPAYFPLLPGSPAIDAGTNTGCPTDSQNGVTRPKDGDNNGSAICDIGSYEAPLPLLVSAHSLQTVYTDTGPAAFTVTYNQAV
ncbi:MAG: CSLREA domain-containing protein, partial [Chloroflexota bacterium]